jgi:hypothetical protein
MNGCTWPIIFAKLAPIFTTLPNPSARPFSVASAPLASFLAEAYVKGWDSLLCERIIGN